MRLDQSCCVRGWGDERMPFALRCSLLKGSTVRTRQSTRNRLNEALLLHLLQIGQGHAVRRTCGNNVRRIMRTIAHQKWKVKFAGHEFRALFQRLSPRSRLNVNHGGSITAAYRSGQAARPPYSGVLGFFKRLGLGRRSGRSRSRCSRGWWSGGFRCSLVCLYTVFFTAHIQIAAAFGQQIHGRCRKNNKSNDEFDHDKFPLK